MKSLRKITLSDNSTVVVAKYTEMFYSVHKA